MPTTSSSWSSIRFGSIRSLCLLLICLCPLAARPAPAGDAATKPAVNDKLDPAFVGVWEITTPSPNGELKWRSDVAPSGRYVLTFLTVPNFPPETGMMEAKDGKFSIRADVTGRTDQGKYEFAASGDEVTATGTLGVGTWKRVSKLSTQKPADQAVAAAPPAVPAAESAPLPQGRALDAGEMEDFPRLRADAAKVASAWAANSRCFRADLWGAYAASRFKPAGARFLFFAGNQGLEVRVQNNALQPMRYPLDLAAAPQPLPDATLGPEDALIRLWELAPTIRADQIYLQLLRPGVEKPSAVADDSSATSYPLQSFLANFPVGFHDPEKSAPHDRPAWRIAAVRDFDVACDAAYGAFLYIDAASGAALSKRQPAVGVQVFMRHGLTPASPIQPYVFPNGDIPLDSPAEQIGTFDPLAVAQKAESIDLGLRAMVRDGRSDDEIRRAVDSMYRWWDRVQQVRQEDASRGIAVLEDAHRANPADARRMLALLTRYVAEIEKEKKSALASDVVTRIGGRQNNKSQFWLERQFEVSPEVLGTRNQTHVVLDTRTNEWLYKLQDPPHTGVFSKYYRPAVALIQSAAPLAGREDLDLQRQTTRLRWLVGGNGPAIGDGDSLNPIDPLQLMAFAEYNRVRGSETLVEAARLRLPKSWSTVSRRELGNGDVEITTTTFTRPPSVDELNAADRLDAVARQQQAPRVAQLQDLALKCPAADARIYYMWARVEAAFYDLHLAERVVQRGLLIDPGSAELHAARLIAWQQDPKVNGAEEYLVEKFSAPYTAADLVGGASLSKDDAWAGYYLSLQRLRIAPEDVGSHAILAETIAKLHGIIINDQEPMPDALEQSQRELGVAAAMMSRLLDRPNDWHFGIAGKQAVSRQTLVGNMVGLLDLRGEDLSTLRRPEEARVCFQKVLALDPANQRALQGMQSLGR